MELQYVNKLSAIKKMNIEQYISHGSLYDICHYIYIILVAIKINEQFCAEPCLNIAYYLL